MGKVKGYMQLNEEQIALMNANKEYEERLLRVMDYLDTLENVDERWLSRARQHIEEGFMALNRSIAKPERLKDI